MVGSFNTDIDKITPWLLAVNFTIAIFSVNFTFFGYQLSKYKAIYSEITTRQWLNITTLLILPFVPLLCFLIVPETFGKSALLILPVLIFSAIDNAKLTSKYLSPSLLIKNSMSDRSIAQYLGALSGEIKSEVDSHNAYLQNRDKFQIPTHAYKFEPGILGISEKDLWDSIAVITRLSITNHDYPIFRHSMASIFKLALASYLFKPTNGDEDNCEIASGLTSVTLKRLRSIIESIIELDSDGIFLHSLSSELCGFLVKDEVLKNPCSDLASAISSDVVWVGTKMLESNSVIEPLKILNTLHRVIELGIYRLESDESKGTNNIDKYNISSYAYDIKALGVAALNSNNSHFAYRCMETLSYLGCNAAKLRATQTIVSVLESMVQLGRLAKKLNIGCFWFRCLIPAESHVEEFMGHILTWLVQDISTTGDFYMKEYAEQAYSRLRGIKCVIKPKAGSNPKFWIEELEENGEKIAHIEYESGMWGYDGQLDYSDFSNLKEYVLHGIGSDFVARTIHTTPVPISSSDKIDEL